MIFCLHHCNFVVIIILRLELSIGDALKKVEEMESFKKIIADIYSFYSRSPKMKNELIAIASKMKDKIQLREFSKVFEVRWAFSSKTATDSFLHNLAPLISHLEITIKRLSSSLRKMKKPTKTKAKVHAKYCKLKNCLDNVKSFSFISQLCLLNDCLAELTSLSLMLQKESAPSYAIWPRICSVKKALLEYGYLVNDDNGNLVGNNGPLTKELFSAIESADEYFVFKGATFKVPSAEDLNAFLDVRKLFISSLVERLSRRFSGLCQGLLEWAQIFDPLQWKTPTGEKETFGGYEIRNLAIHFGFNITECSLLIANFRNMKRGMGVSTLLKNLIAKLETLPFTTSECERGSNLHIHSSVYFTFVYFIFMPINNRL